MKFDAVIRVSDSVAVKERHEKFVKATQLLREALDILRDDPTFVDEAEKLLGGVA